MALGTISLRYANNERVIVRCYRTGYLAIHRTPLLISGNNRCGHKDTFEYWRISHIPTGYLVCEVAQGLTDAAKLARILENSLDWQGIQSMLDKGTLTKSARSDNGAIVQAIAASLNVSCVD
jgi:hypothetical protein